MITFQKIIAKKLKNLMNKQWRNMPTLYALLDQTFIHLLLKNVLIKSEIMPQHKKLDTK